MKTSVIATDTWGHTNRHFLGEHRGRLNPDISITFIPLKNIKYIDISFNVKLENQKDLKIIINHAYKKTK